MTDAIADETLGIPNSPRILSSPTRCSKTSCTGTSIATLSNFSMAFSFLTGQRQARDHPPIDRRGVEELLAAARFVDRVEMVSSKAGELVPRAKPHSVDLLMYICIIPFRTLRNIGNPEGEEDVVVIDQKSRQRSPAVLPL